MIKFGVAGNSNSFYAEGHKSTVEAAKWCKDRGIDCFEYSFGRGVTIGSDKAKEIGEVFKDYGVELSVHAPYFINFSNIDPLMIEKSIGYVLTSLKMLKAFGGERVVFHPASQGKLLREEAHAIALDNIGKLATAIKDNGYEEYKICPETMGKQNQMGTVSEVIDYCNLADFFYPCIDFGHVNAREQGILKTALNYNTIIEEMLQKLPENKVKSMHIHFSKIQYGAKGELKHLTFEDDVFGPEFPPLAESLRLYHIEPYVISESDGTQAEDAVEMKRIYFSMG